MTINPEVVAKASRRRFTVDYKLSTFILISQNHETRLSEGRNQLDLQINLLTEQENTKLLRMLERIAAECRTQQRSKPPSIKPRHESRQVNRADRSDISGRFCYEAALEPLHPPSMSLKWIGDEANVCWFERSQSPTAVRLPMRDRPISEKSHELVVHFLCMCPVYSMRPILYRQ